MDINLARENMLKQQIRTWDVLDDAVLNVIETTPREAFVPQEYRQMAFAEINVPLGHEQIMMTPCVEGRLLQALVVKPEDKILEIGTGSGYFTALLARSGQHVYSIDIIPEFLQMAESNLKRMALSNVTLQEGNAAKGWEKQQPYDVICITGGLPAIPSSFKQELKIGGRLFAIVGGQHVMEAVLVTRNAENDWQQQILFETEIPMLLNGPQKGSFSF